MTSFIGTGRIASEVMRRETRIGVVASFRLDSGPTRRGRLWIDVETWGHSAGTIHQHGHEGRLVLVAGRVAQKSWTAPATGERHRRIVITATDIDLLPGNHSFAKVGLPNAVIAAGTVADDPVASLVSRGSVTTFEIATGAAGTKSGRLWLPVRWWQSTQDPSVPERGDHVSISGHLQHRRHVESGGQQGGARLELNALHMA